MREIATKLSINLKINTVDYQSYKTVSANAQTVNKEWVVIDKCAWGTLEPVGGAPTTLLGQSELSEGDVA